MISDTFFSSLFLVPSWASFFAVLAPSWASSWTQTDPQNNKNGSRKAFFFTLVFFHWNLNDFHGFFMFFQGLKPLLASAGPTKYALSRKSVISLPRIILDSFLNAFWSFWPPQIGVNRLWAALPNRSEFWSIFEAHFFAILMILGSPRGPRGPPNFWDGPLFEPFCSTWSPGRGQMPFWRRFLSIF